MSVVLNQDEQLALVEAANRAPSVHNIQPARWRFGDDGRVWLLEDTRRQLPVGDPSGRDNSVSLGAAFEGMHLALAQRGLALAPPLLGAAQLTPPVAPPLRVVAASRIVTGVDDPLAHWVKARRSYRDVFQKVDKRECAALAQRLDALGDIIAIAACSDIQELARLNDHYSAIALSQPAYQSELYHWMRFSKRNPAWARDGLNADALALNTVERLAAGVLLHPAVFRVLMSLRLGGLVIAESTKTASAAAIGIFVANRQEPAFTTGRRFYRVWLEISRMGYALCPMSVLSDSEQCANRLHEQFRIAADLRIINVFRIGKQAYLPDPSPRLPARELLV